MSKGNNDHGAVGMGLQEELFIAEIMKEVAKRIEPGCKVRGQAFC